MSQETFAALGVSEESIAALEERGITSPFQIQTRAIPPALAGTDLLAKSPTGSGKTLALRHPDRRARRRATTRGRRRSSSSRRASSPSRSRSRSRYSRRPATSWSRASTAASPLRPQANRARDAHIIVATPGRLQDLLDRRLVTLDAVEILVLDEADRMLDMGFKPQVDRIVQRLPRDRQTMFFSATLDGEVGELARSYTQSPARIEASLPTEHGPGEIEHRFVSVTQDTKVEKLVELLAAERGLALVFVRTQARGRPAGPQARAARCRRLRRCTAT